MAILRKYILMNFSGDDTYILLKILQDTMAIQAAMQGLCHDKQ